MRATRYGPWTVVGRRADGELLVAREGETAVQHRLVLVDGDLPEGARWPLHLGLVARVDHAPSYWVLDDGHAHTLADLVPWAESHGPIGLELVGAIAWPALTTLTALHIPQGTCLRKLGLRDVVMDRGGQVRLVPPLPRARTGGPRSSEADPSTALEPLAPEVLQGFSLAGLTPACDVFAACALLYRLLAGAWPHGAADDAVAMGNMLSGKFTPLGALRPGLPLELERAIERGLALEPRDRWPDAAALLTALAPHLPDREECARALEAMVRSVEPTSPGALEPPRSAVPPPAVPPPALDDDDALVLPRALEPWRTELSMFPPELALALGDTVRRAARLIGPLRVEADVTSGSPDGYRGVARRGPLSRLLLSEWAIALELPDEFLRRVAMNEQLFTALAYKEPGGARRSLALFDAGPRSLGGPRVVQLAVLIALAARARIAGVRFGWGLLQDERRSQIAELNEASVRRLVEGRSLEEVSAVDGAEWAIAIGEPSEADDLWLIGPSAIERAVALGGGTRVVVEDVADPERFAVELTLARPRATPRRVELELPPAPICVRLLREPFARTVKVLARDPDAALGPVVRMWFEPHGRILVERRADRAVTWTYVPRTRRETVPSPIRREVEGETLLDATVAASRAFTVETLERRLVIRRLGSRGGLAHRWDFDLPPEMAAHAVTLGVFVRGKALEVAWLHDARGVLWRAEPNGRFEQYLEGVGVLQQVAGSLLFAQRMREHRIEIGQIQGTVRSVLGAWPTEAPTAMVLAMGSSTVPGAGAAAAVAPGRWMYPGSGGAIELSAPESAWVVAVAFVDGRFGLVHVADDERTLLWRAAKEERALYVSQRPIEQVAVNPRVPVIAVLDDAGRLRVVDTEGDVRFERGPS